MDGAAVEMPPDWVDPCDAGGADVESLGPGAVPLDEQADATIR